MQRTMLKSKIHRVKVTGACVDYEGSVTIDSTLIKKKLGSLSKADRKQVEKEWRKLFVFEAS